MSEAEDRYLAQISEDFDGVLGPGIELLDLERQESQEAVRLVARYRLADRVRESAAVGENVVVAHAMLRGRLLIDRIRLGFTTLVEGPEHPHGRRS